MTVTAISRSEQSTSQISRTTRIVKAVVFVSCQCLCSFSFVGCLMRRRTRSALLALLSMLLVCLPGISEKLFKCKLRTTFCNIAMFYAVGPLLGETYKLYYITNWWDKLLHCTGGVVFAVLGLHLYSRLSNEHGNYILGAIFALCFSMAISVSWEFFEYGSDAYLGTDMQHDTVVHSINSYYLGDEPGVRGSIDGITEVTVDGQALPADGYIDIGLHDTMGGMMIETLGALLYSLSFIFDKGRHPLIIPLGSKSSAAA